MQVEQIYTGCLAHGAYYVRSAGEAVLIDPLRETQPYLDRLERDGVQLKYVLETHFHADFVSGHLDLAQQTGAAIVYGPTAAPDFAAHMAADGERLRVGRVTLEVLHTPGHTLESSCYLLRDEHERPVALFTGDTLFLGDVGRPDLAQAATGLTQHELAGLLYDSLQTKILPLPDEVTVYPGHGAGSACGKHMSAETVDTLGHQKATNYALRPGITRAEFVQEVTAGLLPPPAYFPANARLNKAGYGSFGQVLTQGLTPLSPADFQLVAESAGALVLDTRRPEDVAPGFVPGSVNIGLDGSFAPWVGALVQPLSQPLLLVTEPGREEETVTRLARVGYDQSLGYLSGGPAAWQQAGHALDTIESVTAEELGRRLAADPATVVVDVRRAREFADGALTGAVSVPLDALNEQLAAIPQQGPVYVYCAGGYRSMMAVSVLQARGWRNLINVAGGFQAIRQAGLPLAMPASEPA
ncbi:MBL fold metallo-hydrolase [Hymenobacter sp. NST-14]|nr:MBL fold metallo-hydrolase [Hymenobacter piscis]